MSWTSEQTCEVRSALAENRGVVGYNSALTLYDTPQHVCWARKYLSVTQAICSLR